MAKEPNPVPNPGRKPPPPPASPPKKLGNEAWESVFTMPLPDGKRIEVRVEGGKVTVDDFYFLSQKLVRFAQMIPRSGWKISFGPSTNDGP